MADDTTDDQTAPNATDLSKALNSGSEVAKPPLKPFSKRGTHSPVPSKPSSTGYRAEIPQRRVIDNIPQPGRQNRPSEHDGRKLIVGKEIQLSGEISSCDHLVVEGRVEANLTGAGTIEVTQEGHFKGKADVQTADITGQFEGELTVRKQLTLRAGGALSGDIRCADLIVESGGRIDGTMAVIDE